MSKIDSLPNDPPDDGDRVFGLNGSGESVNYTLPDLRTYLNSGPASVAVTKLSVDTAIGEGTSDSDYYGSDKVWRPIPQSEAQTDASITGTGVTGSPLSVDDTQIRIPANQVTDFDAGVDLALGIATDGAAQRFLAADGMFKAVNVAGVVPDLTGVLSDDIGEGITNLYFTTARALASTAGFVDDTNTFNVNDLNLWSGTRAQYNALTSYDPNTIYSTTGDFDDAIAIGDVDGLRVELDGKVDDSQVQTNVPAGAVFTDTDTNTQLTPDTILGVLNQATGNIDEDLLQLAPGTGGGGGGGLTTQQVDARILAGTAGSVEDNSDSTAPLGFWSGTRSEYDAIAAPDPNTLYNTIGDFDDVPDSIDDLNSEDDLRFWTGTRAEYDALTSYDPNTIYTTTGDFTEDIPATAPTEPNRLYTQTGTQLGITGAAASLKFVIQT